MNIKTVIRNAAIVFAIAALAPAAAGAEDISAISEGASNNAAVFYDGDDFDNCISPGIRVIAYNKPMILSSKPGEDIRFSPEAFNNYAGYVPSSVKIVYLPDESAGTLMYDSSPVSEGQSISVLSMSSLYFNPASDVDAQFGFTTDNQNIIRCILRRKDSDNNAPKNSSNETTAAWTRTDSPIMGYLAGYDPDGDSVEFEITSYPLKGLLSLSDKSTGEFVYSPYSKVSGTDQFTYRIRDAYGSYSPEYTMAVNVRHGKADIYDDMKKSNYSAAAYDAVLSGIMQTQKTADGEFFMPNEPVSRIDFLIMTMKAMGADSPKPVSKTSFADDSSLSDEERGYLSAAYKLGIIHGSISDGVLVFNPDSAITGAEAAVMINGILGLPENDSVSAAVQSTGVPVWAASSVSALTGIGIIDRYTAPASGIITRESAAVILTRLMQKLA